MVLMRHVHVEAYEDKVDADEYEVEAYGTASDQEHMTQLQDEIVEQLMQIME